MLRGSAVQEVQAWLADCRMQAGLKVQKIPWKACREWVLSDSQVIHESGGFFGIIGAENEKSGERSVLIDQPEIGILGFLVCVVDRRVSWLVQAKAEPGNEDAVQIAPTVQATESNYLRRHGGAATRYIDWFRKLPQRGSVLSDTLQSEQGSRFYQKRNRNVLIDVGEAEAVLCREPWWRWVDADCLRQLLRSDYAVNTDARSTIVTAPWSLISETGDPFEGDRERFHFRAALRASLLVGDVGADQTLKSVLRRLVLARREAGRARRISLSQVSSWTKTSTELTCREEQGVSICPYRVEVLGREIPDWDQPLFQNTNDLEIILVGQMRRGTLHFLFRLSYELGLWSRVELGPSVQLVRGVEGVWSEILADRGNILNHCSVKQSDEGGRFFKTRALYRVVEIDAAKQVPVGRNSVWLTVQQVRRLCGQPGMLNNEARSLVSLLLAFA